MTYFTKNAELKNGYNTYIDADVDDMGTMMDVGLLLMEEGDVFVFEETEKEIAVLLFSGDVTYEWDNEACHAVRPDAFHHEPYCLHGDRATKIILTAHAHSELYIQKTKNLEYFKAVMYTPENIDIELKGYNGELKGAMKREIKTFFDYSNAPYSNMVLGEVLNHPGKWSSYPPHHHPQPEVYFYRFDYPDGFGAGFSNGEIYKTGHNGLAVINHGFHSQCTAPGYAMVYAWGIRHLDGDPWDKTRIDDPEHAWLWKPDANDHIYDG